MTRYDEIVRILKSHPFNPYGARKITSVLIPLIEIEGETHILYETRALHLKAQPGEVAFPGGRWENGETEEETAVRETGEELLIPRESIEILGRIDSIATSFETIIHCFVGRIHMNFSEIQPSSEEVHDIFVVPLKWLMENAPECYQATSKFEMAEDFPFELIPNGRDYILRGANYPVRVYRYQGHTIWGLTARLTDNFVNLIRSNRRD